MKRLLALPLLLVLMTLPLQGATISFLVIETGLWEDAKANEYSSLWENSLMEVFFEEGHIVSNSPVLRLAEKSDKEFPDEAMGDLSGAVEGSIIKVDKRKGRAKIKLDLYNDSFSIDLAFEVIGAAARPGSVL